jgi:hypothetical protein
MNFDNLYCNKKLKTYRYYFTTFNRGCWIEFGIYDGIMEIFENKGKRSNSFRKADKNTFLTDLFGHIFKNKFKMNDIMYPIDRIYDYLN